MFSSCTIADPGPTNSLLVVVIASVHPHMTSDGIREIIPRRCGLKVVFSHYMQASSVAYAAYCDTHDGVPRAGSFAMLHCPAAEVPGSPLDASLPVNNHICSQQLAFVLVTQQACWVTLPPACYAATSCATPAQNGCDALEPVSRPSGCGGLRFN